MTFPQAVAGSKVFYFQVCAKDVVAAIAVLSFDASVVSDAL